MQPEDLKRLRERLACSVGELAAALGVEVKTVLSWEAGDLFPTKRHVDRMKALDARGPSGVKRKGAAKAPAESGVLLLAEPRLWALVRKLVTHRELFAKVETLAADYADPAERDAK